MRFRKFRMIRPKTGALATFTTIEGKRTPPLPRCPNGHPFMHVSTEPALSGVLLVSWMPCGCQSVGGSA